MARPLLLFDSGVCVGAPEEIGDEEDVENEKEVDGPRVVEVIVARDAASAGMVATIRTGGSENT
jgi:hypothetical protein